LIVIADNCSDQTGAIALSLGASVLERYNPKKLGKGYALDYGLKHLESDPPDIVVFVDADCIVKPGAIMTIAQQAHTHQRPVQAVYLLESPPNPKPKDLISTLAFRVKNLVRPYGLFQLGLPCLLTGTGMAFPWSVIQQVSLASSNIVEDMQLGLDLAVAGYFPMFEPTARVMGHLPQQQQATTQQRKRWEHGHLQTLTTQILRLVKVFFQQGRWELMAIALELAVPPLSLLVGIWSLVAIAGLTAGILGLSWLPAGLSMVSGMLIFIAVISACTKFARDLPLVTLLAVPRYMLWKIPLYFSFLVNPEKKWIRTERD
jgi:cellulose synthase/poly-beta-1,6-N-acetylglucosamine synthase-like glycosyltransferase